MQIKLAAGAARPESAHQKLKQSLQPHLCAWGCHRKPGWLWPPPPAEPMVGVASHLTPHIGRMFPLLFHCRRQRISFSMGVKGSRHFSSLIFTRLTLTCKGKSQSCLAGLLPSFAVRDFHEKSWQYECLQQRFFMTLAIFLFWAHSSFYLFTPFGYHIFVLLSEPVVTPLPGANRHKKFCCMDLLSTAPSCPGLRHSHSTLHSHTALSPFSPLPSN